MAEAAEAFALDEIELDYNQTGKVPLPPVSEAESMVYRGLRLPVGLHRRALRTSGDDWGHLVGAGTGVDRAGTHRG